MEPREAAGASNRVAQDPHGQPFQSGDDGAFSDSNSGSDGPSGSVDFGSDAPSARKRYADDSSDESGSSGSGSDSEKTAAKVSMGKSFKCVIHDLSTGQREEFPSMTDAALSLEISPQNVGKAFRKGALIRKQFAVTAHGQEVPDNATDSFEKINRKKGRLA